MLGKKKRKSDIAEAFYSSALALHKVGALDKTTMRDFDMRHQAAMAQDVRDLR